LAQAFEPHPTLENVEIVVEPHDQDADRSDHWPCQSPRPPVRAGQPGLHNRYAYAANNPTWTDPSGHAVGLGAFQPDGSITVRDFGCDLTAGGIAGVYRCLAAFTGSTTGGLVALLRGRRRGRLVRWGAAALVCWGGGWGLVVVEGVLGLVDGGG
jgi:hypothetical protein